MAPHSSRNYVLACTIPAAIAVAAYIWVKKKKKRLRIVRQKDEIRRSTPLLANDLTDVASPRTSTTTCSNHLVQENGANCSTASLNGEIRFGSEAPNIQAKVLDSEAQSIETNSSFVKEENKIIKIVELETCDSDAQTENCTLNSDDNSETIALCDSSIIAANDSFVADSKLDVSIISIASCEEGGCKDEINRDDISVELNSGNFDLTLDSSLDTVTTCSLCEETGDSSLHNFSFYSSCSSVTSSQLRMLDDSFVNAERLSSTPNSSPMNDTYDKDLSDCSLLSVIPEESVVNDSSCAALCDSSSAMVIDGGDDEVERQQAAAADYLDSSVVSSTSLCDGFVDKCQISDKCETTEAVSGETNVEPIDYIAVAELEKEIDLKTDAEREIPLALSPSLSTEEPELQKLTNGHETSAYGSASQSPAEELLGSPTASNYSDHNEWSQSERSSDSGKCESDNAPKLSSSIENMQVAQVYEFEIPSQLCGRMIGFKGQNVRGIKAQTRAEIAIGPHLYDGTLKMCAVLGSESEIRAALDLIRKRFPLCKYPDLSLAQINIQILSPMTTISDTMQLQLPEGVSCDVILSSLVSAGHFFVQQPTHPTYSSLCQLDQIMGNCYLDESGGAPALPAVEQGNVCAAEAMGGWFRAQVVYTEEEECDVRFLDYGGYARHSIYSLRQIRSDFMSLPFQASECYLANVVPISESGWTLEATKFFENLAQGQILQAQIVAYADNGIPLVQLYRIQGAVSTFINSELVNHGHATWVEHQI